MLHPSDVGDARAEPFDLGVSIDVGAPLPHLLVDGLRAVLVFHAGLYDPTRYGRSVTVVGAGDEVDRLLGWVVFRGASFASLGPPNDEAFEGHPLAQAGLRPYEAHVVHNSPLIAEMERRNRVHPYHRMEAFASAQHVVIPFHDETFECVCGSWTSGTLTCAFPIAMRVAADALVRGLDVLELPT